jgi:CheY-like chemotaxis protein
MVVDDSLTSRQLIKEILRAAGYRVAVADSGRKALEIMATESIDLFVIDIEMPGMDGFELSQAIRRSDRYKQAPIVILSTRGSDLDKRRGIDVGANAYIVKGVFDQQEFLSTLASFASE